MKKQTSLLLIALFGAASAYAQNTAVTIPVGYVTETILASQFNLLGVTMHQSPAAAGTLDTVGTDKVTDAAVDFDTVLTTGKKYILEINDGTGAGTIEVVATWTGSQLDTSNLTLAGVAPGDKYTIRAATTVADLFGAANSAGLQATANADPAEADIVWIPDGAGGFTLVFYSTLSGLTGWLDTINYDPAIGAATPIIYADAVYVERKGATNISLTVNGEVKKFNTILACPLAFNNVGGVYPVGVTISDTNLASVVQSSANADPAEADIVWIPDGAGGFTLLFYSTLPGLTGWLDTINYDPIIGAATPLVSGMLIERKKPTAYEFTIDPPTAYDNL